MRMASPPMTASLQRRAGRRVGAGAQQREHNCVAPAVRSIAQQRDPGGPGRQRPAALAGAGRRAVERVELQPGVITPLSGRPSVGDFQGIACKFNG
jgi:hypothetical protein